jgi:hypothetical protein
MKNGFKISGNRPRRCSGSAGVWVLVAIVILGVAGFFIWKKLNPPKPPVVAIATPVPVTPSPATLEPEIVKATPRPTPTPVVVAATPTPPPSLDFATVARSPSSWPQQITLTQSASFPVIIGGRVAGDVKVPVGTVMRFLRLNNLNVEVEYQNARQLVPATCTDLMQRALVTFRTNGFVIPTTTTTAAAPLLPVATAASSATPAPAKTDIPNVEVTADRKRLDVDRGQMVAEGGVHKASEKFQYVVKVQKRSFVDVPALDIKYVIFVERQKLGETKDSDTIERVTGGGKTEPLIAAVRSQTVDTGEFELWERSLVGDFYYPNGGRRKVLDNVKGVWVKVFYEGKMIGEYANPSTITKRGWE